MSANLHRSVDIVKHNFKKVEHKEPQIQGEHRTTELQYRRLRLVLRDRQSNCKPVVFKIWISFYSYRPRWILPSTRQYWNNQMLRRTTNNRKNTTDNINSRRISLLFNKCERATWRTESILFCRTCSLCLWANDIGYYWLCLYA